MRVSAYIIINEQEYFKLLILNINHLHKKTPKIKKNICKYIKKEEFLQKK
jgi:hypothetical protein